MLKAKQKLLKRPEVWASGHFSIIYYYLFVQSYKGLFQSLMGE